MTGIRRSFWLARAQRPPGQQRHARASLLIVLHGSGMDGRAMARSTDLARRAPAAGVTTVFPDAWKGAWHPIRPPHRQPNLDDALFLTALSSHVEVIGAAQSWPVFLAGMAQGALFAEHLARHGLLPVAGLFLVGGSALEVSRRLAPVPQLHTTMTLIMGTRDRVIPYQGGPPSRRGVSGALLRRRASWHGALPGEDVVAGAEDIVAEWAAGNGIRSAPRIEELTGDPVHPRITLKTWTAPGCRPATLYSIDGGHGHGWPGGPHTPPSRATGPVTGGLDATGVLLGMATRESSIAAGHRALERLPPGGTATAVRTGTAVKDRDRRQDRDGPVSGS